MLFLLNAIITRVEDGIGTKLLSLYRIVNLNDLN